MDNLLQTPLQRPLKQSTLFDQHISPLSVFLLSLSVSQCLSVPWTVCLSLRLSATRLLICLTSRWACGVGWPILSVCHVCNPPVITITLRHQPQMYLLQYFFYVPKLFYNLCIYTFLWAFNACYSVRYKNEQN